MLGTGIVLRWPSTIPWAVLLTGGGYLITREGRSVVDGWATVLGVLLLLAAELASWSIEHDARIRAEGSLVLQRVLMLGLLTGSALLVSFLLLGAAGVTGSAGLAVAAAGIAAAVGAIGILVRLVRS